MSSESQKTSTRNSIKRLIEVEILDRVDEWDEGTGPGVPGLLRKFGEARLLGSPTCTARCGQGSDLAGHLLLAEELGRLKCVSLAGALSVQAQFATAALAWRGSADVQREFLAPAVAGQQIAGLHRPAAGTRQSTAPGTLHARRRGGDYLLTGSGLRVANASPSGWMWMTCTDPESASAAPPMGVVVPGHLPGVSIVGAFTSGGPVPGYASVVSLDAVRVPLYHAIRLTSPEADREQRDEDRLFAAALYLSRIEEIIAITGDYLASGRLRGGPAVSTQLLAARLAEMQAEVASARALIGHAARERQSGSDARAPVLMARYKVARLARAVPGVCLKIWGRAACAPHNLIVRMSQDMTLYPFDGSTPEMLVRELSGQLGFDAPLAGPRKPAARIHRSPGLERVVH